MTPAGPRPLTLDVTHLVARAAGRGFTGIEVFDRAVATRLLAEGRLAAGLHYGLWSPHVLDPAHVKRALEARPASPIFSMARALVPELLRGSGAIPLNAIYLNLAHYLFEHPRFFRWLPRRPDVTAVFMIHDFLPRLYPEYFPKRKLAIFERRLATALSHGGAFVVSTAVVAEQLRGELRRLGRAEAPVLVQPLPSSLPEPPTVARSGDYFLMLGTIEPRKNHLLALNLWRRLASERRSLPRLVIVGERGWENEQTLALLERSPALRGNVIERSGLAAAELAALVKGARALLAPSFDEGYGLPMVEALTLGTPVIASDIPVFREVSQGCARLLSPLDGDAWAAEIIRMSEDRAYEAAARECAAQFAPPSWAGYFAALDAFLDSL